MRRSAANCQGMLQRLESGYPVFDGANDLIFGTLNCLHALWWRFGIVVNSIGHITLTNLLYVGPG